MTVSQALRSIKTDTKSWYVVINNTNKVIMSNGQGYYFIRKKGEYQLINPSLKVEMNYVEGDAVAEQLWMYLVDVIVGHI